VLAQSVGRSGYRIPLEDERYFQHPSRPALGSHPACRTMVTGSFKGLKRSGRGGDHPPPSRAEVEGRVEVYICSRSGPSWPVIG
jgi:hypothetical protein